jgi:hypothetical protein
MRSVKLGPASIILKGAVPHTTHLILTYALKSHRRVAMPAWYMMIVEPEPAVPFAPDER